MHAWTQIRRTQSTGCSTVMATIRLTCCLPVMGISANVPAEGTTQVYSHTPSLWPLELFSTHRQSPLSHSRVTVAVWGSGTNAFRQTCGSQLRTRLGQRPQRSRTGRLTRSSTRSPNANPRENNKTAAGGPGRVLIVSVKNSWRSQKPLGRCANVQSDSQ